MSDLEKRLRELVTEFRAYQYIDLEALADRAARIGAEIEREECAAAVYQAPCDGAKRRALEAENLDMRTLAWADMTIRARGGK